MRSAADVSAADPLGNADIARHVAGLAQLLAAHRENPYKIKPYRSPAFSASSSPANTDVASRW